MPIYEYECDDCECHFEIKQGFNDPPGASCPRCQGKARRIFQLTPVIFKGSGFYVTDNRPDNGEKKEGEKKEGEKKEGEKKGEEPIKSK